jgi:hypothetical protein
MKKSTEQTTPEKNEVTEVSLTSISLFSVTDATVKQIIEDYKGLTITSIDDKDGVKAVTEAYKHCVNIRNRIDKRRLEINRHTNTQAKKHTDALAPTEADLGKKLDVHNNAVALKQQ